MQGLQIQGSKGNTYNVYQSPKTQAWVCSCPAWKFQKGVDGEHRVCKHILQVTASLSGHVVAAINVKKG